MSAHCARRRPARRPCEAPRLWAVLCAGVAACALAQPAYPAEDRIAIQGEADGEVWDTGTRSILLSLNDGDVAPQGRLRLWVAGRFAERVEGMILGRFERGQAGEYVVGASRRAELEQAWVRWTVPAPFPLVAQAGKMPQPIGGFSRRYLASDNPLIGRPVNYDMDYPHALELVGRAGPVDFAAAVVDQPLQRQIWLSGASSALRPALAAGVTPFTGFRMGAYVTRGPYLSRDVERYLPAGRNWRDYDQSVVGFDLQFSRGHFELLGEMTRSLFEMPGQPDERGIVWYLEPKYTWSPRWFTALRVEKNDQTSVWLPYVVNWFVTDEDSWDLEAGVGFRIDPGTLLKVSYRVERSTEYPTFTPEADHAVALQISHRFDVKGWFQHPR